jgi:UDP-N-acetylmuramoyl-tripeptide--D-alanyl-D-alanine ligase
MLTISEIVKGARGRLVRGDQASDPPVDSVVIDSRRAAAGSLFVALKGERQDGHDFLLDAVRRGALAVLVNDSASLPVCSDLPLYTIAVPDTAVALRNLAAYWRGKHDIDVVGITGSIGKTSTKELAAAVLGHSFSVLKSEGNLNTDYGLALALLRLRDDHQVAVLEMGGAYKMGEIAELARLARPRIGIVTTVAPVHLELMGTIEAIAETKSELIQALPAEGFAVLNGDNELVRQMAAKAKCPIVFFGRGDGCDVRAANIRGYGLDGFGFDLCYHGESVPVRMPVLGKHNIYTALPAAAAGLLKGMSAEQVAAALSDAAIGGRLTVRRLSNGCRVIDDTYNASPDSVCAALDVLAEAPGSKIAVLGDMFELGSYEVEGHRRVGKHAAAVADRLILVGELSRNTCCAAAEAGMAGEQVFWVASKAEAVAILQDWLTEDSVVLVKGSRGMAMEEIVREVCKTN